MLLESIWSHIFLMPEKESITWGLPNYLNIVDLPYFCHYCYCTPPPTYLNLPLDWDFAYQFFPVGMPFPLSSVLTFHYSLTQPHSLSGLHFSTLRSLYIPNVSDPPAANIENFIQLVSRSALTSLFPNMKPKWEKPWGACKKLVA